MTEMLQVTQISIGRFHHFNLARQLELHGMLGAIYTGYPRFKLREETGIPQKKIRTFPWLQTVYMARDRFGFNNPVFGRELAWMAQESLDWYVSKRTQTKILLALSGSGLRAGAVTKRNGGWYICDRSSSHIRYQDEILREEYRRWGLECEGVDPRVIRKEECEYEMADRIVVPSEFVFRSFVEQGVPATKLEKVSFGARLERFFPVGEPDPEQFTVLFVGQVSFRKGILYLLDAFSRLRHPNKRLIVAGVVHDEIRPFLGRYDLRDVHFYGKVPNSKLPELYSQANVMVLPSIEEGLSCVQGESLACGCPVISTPNSGGEDLFSDEIEGFIVPIRNPDAILEKLEVFAQDPGVRSMMAAASLKRVAAIGGWDRYGNEMAQFLQGLQR